VDTARWVCWRARQQPQAGRQKVVGKAAVVGRWLAIGHVWRTGAAFQRGLRWLGGGLLIVAWLGGCQTKFATVLPLESGVGVFMTTERRTYSEKETISVTFGVLNRSTQPLTLRFRTAQRYDVIVQDMRGQEVWRWSTDQFFTPALGEENLAPREGALSYRVSVRHPLPAGRYIITAIMPAVEARMSASMEIEVR
jgi:hypothetical protein